MGWHGTRWAGEFSGNATIRLSTNEQSALTFSTGKAIIEDSSCKSPSCAVISGTPTGEAAGGSREGGREGPAEGGSGRLSEDCRT